MYAEKPFRVRPEAEVFEDIAVAARLWPDTRRVFLADGDAMILKTGKLTRILDELSNRFHELERVAIYTDARGIETKTDQELAELKTRKLGIAYIGLESGSENVLNKIKKGSTAAEMTRAVLRAESASIQTSVIALLGIAGKAYTEAHAVETARVISEMSPSFFSALTLTLIPGTPLADEAEKGFFVPITPEESLCELSNMVSLIQPFRPVVFRTNHASNYVPLRGVLPEDRGKILTTIDKALKEGALRPEWARGL